ncbi:MAG: large extracellular alpha-helical protein [Verrucomicrobiales bacterium]|nr:large extracellular alpha-helical protein [Verrucomicrobiales bacterium]
MVPGQLFLTDWQLLLRLPPSYMKPSLFFPVLLIPLAAGFMPSLKADALGEAEDQLRARQYGQAAASLADGKAAEAVTAAEAVPADSRWARKARFLKAQALSDQKKFAEAETLLAGEAAQALASARKDGLAGRLAEFGDELARVPAPGEIDVPPANPAAAALLYRRALEVEFQTPDFTEATLFKLAVTLQKLGQAENALAVLNDYLIQFDRDWIPAGVGRPGSPDAQGARGDAGPAVEKPRGAKRFIQPGRHIPEARLRLTQCLMSRPDWGPALKTVDSLLALQPAPEPGMMASAAWLRCQIIGGPAMYADQFQSVPEGEANSANTIPSHRANSLLPPPAYNQQVQQIRQVAASSSTDFPRHIDALQAFLAAWPADTQAPEASRLIGQDLLALGRTDEALAAFADFIDGKNYQFDPRLPANAAPDPASGLSPADTLSRRRQETLFKTAQTEFDRKKFESAIARWRAYTVNHPNGGQWAEAQQRIIDAEFQISLEAVAAGDAKQARERLDAFLTQYPLDGRARQILFIYGQTPYAAAQVRELDDRVKTLDGPLPAAATLDLFRSAIEQWSRLIAKYPDSDEASLALYNTALILTDKLDRTEEGLAAFRRLTWGQWAPLAKQRAAILEEKSLAISAPRVFRTNEVPHLALSVRNIKKVKVSRYALDLGAWLRSAHRLDGLEKLDVDLIAPEKTWEVEIGGYEQWRSLQQKIDIPFPDNAAGACVVRVEGDDWQATTLVVRSDIELITEATRGGLLVLALNARENKPAAGASVLVSDGKSIIANGKTGDDGVFLLPHEALPDTVRAFVLTSQGAMVSGLDLTGLTVTEQPDYAVHSVFDRPEYFPGQTAGFLMLRRERKEGAMKPAAGAATLRILAPDNRLVLAQPVSWEADGTVRGQFKIPSNAPAGGYKAQLLATDEQVLISAEFPVMEASADHTPRLLLKLAAPVARPGAKVQATLMADWPWGLPLAGEEVEITFPDGHTGRAETDAAGVLQFEVQATSGTETPWRMESVTVRLPKQPSAQPVTGNLQVTTVEGNIMIFQAPETVPAGGAMTAKIRALGYDGRAAARPVTATLFRYTAPPPSRVLEGVPWISYTPPPTAEEKVESQELTVDEITGEAVSTFKIGDGGHYEVRFAFPDGKVAVQKPFYASGGADPHALRLFASAATVNEGSTAVLRLQSLKPFNHVLVTASADRFLSHQLLSVPQGLTDLPLPVTAAHAPNFQVTATALDGRRLCAASVGLQVRRSLNVALKPAAVPGGNPAVEVTGMDGKPVAATVLHGMIRTSPDPEADFSGTSVAPGTARQELLPLLKPRDLRLAIHTSADLMFPGTSVKVEPATGVPAGAVEVAANDQLRLIAVQGLESDLNRSNSVLLTDNKVFTDLNCFVQQGSPSSRSAGLLLFATGVRRAADSFVQSIILPAIPDAASGGAGEIFAEPGTVGTPLRMPLAVLFSSKAGGGADTEGAAGALTAAPAWRTAEREAGAFHAGELPDGQWQAVVQVWTPQSGVTQASLPVEIRHPLGLRVIKPEAASALLVVTNPSGLEGTLKVTGTGRTRCQTEIKLEKANLRMLFPMETSIEGGATGIRLESADGQLLAAWAPAAEKPDSSVPYLGSSAKVTTAGGVLSGNSVFGLSAPGVPAEPLKYAAGRIFRTPGDLLAALAAASSGGNAELMPASELLAKVTLIQRLRKAGDERKAEVEALTARCRELVSELALREQGGGWAWGGLDISPDILTTAWTWWALHTAKQAGITVSDKLQDRVGKFLTASYAGIPVDDYERKAAVLQAMAAAGQADYANAAPLLRVRDKLSDSALAFLTAALVRMDRPEEARQLLKTLEDRAVRGKTGSTLETASWQGSIRIVRLGEPELVAAMVLWSAARLDPASATGAAAVNSLLSSRLMSPDARLLSAGPVAVALDAWFTGGNDWTEPGDAQFSTAQGPLDQNGNPDRVALPVAEGVNGLTVQPKDGKRVIVSLVLASVPKELSDPKPWANPEFASRRYLHLPLWHSGTELNAASTSPVKTAETGQILNVEVRLRENDLEATRHPQYLIWEEPIPACFALVPDSLEGNWNRVDIFPDRIRLVYGPGVIEPLKYRIVALAPGVSTLAPSILSDAYDLAKYRPGVPASLTVLAPGGKSPDPYEMNQAEHFELARLTFEGGNPAECLKHLDALAPSARRADFEKDLTRMRLWLLTDTPDGDAAQIVQAFETLNERHPSLLIPFDRILRVGRAYQKIGEHERGANVFSAAVEANFLSDSGISAALEDRGDYAGSVDFQEALWFDSPDSEDARGALFALSQGLFRNAANAEGVSVRRGQKKLEKNALLERSRDLLNRFITLYPADALADDAAFSLTNAFFALKDYAAVTAAAESAGKRWPDSPFASQFQYMAALGHFWQFHYAEALAAAAPVANGGSRDRDLARYITGQIYHAEGKPAEAVDWYRKVKAKYPDAADALAAFEEKKINVPEITTLTPGQEVRISVGHRNVKEVSLQIYKVDLMKLYLREKNLSRVTSVNLAGIAPEASVPVDTAQAAPWTDLHTDAVLPLKEEGAYLVIARGDDLFTSGLVLITGLKLDVREDAGAGSVRVNVLGAADGKFVAGAEVKAIASGVTGIQSGQTDPRGIFEASGLSGTATVIVRQGDNRYAFHRGTVALTSPGVTPTTPASSVDPQGRMLKNVEFDPPQIPQSFGGKVLSKDAYLQNVDFYNSQIQEGNLKNWDVKRRSGGQGVQAEKALKK